MVVVKKLNINYQMVNIVVVNHVINVQKLEKRILYLMAKQKNVQFVINNFIVKVDNTIFT